MSSDEIYSIIQRYAPNNAEITNKTYASRINGLLKMGKNIDDYSSTTSYLRSKYKQKTYKSSIIAIVVYLKALGKMELANKYASEMKRVNDIIQDEEKNHVPTSSEKANMVTNKEKVDIINNLKDRILHMTVARDYVSYFDTYKRYLVMNLYHLIPPIRGDFVGCLVYDNPIFFPDLKKNYIYLNTKKLVLNRYKTSKTYGIGNEVNLPDELVDIIKKWMEIREIVYPRLSGNVELLLTNNLQPMGQVNLTQFLNRIFQRNVSSTMLRKSYISEKYPVTHTTNEMQRDATLMQHSVAVQQTTYRKKM